MPVVTDKFVTDANGSLDKDDGQVRLVLQPAIHLEPVGKGLLLYQTNINISCKIDFFLPDLI
jgi:hypothetical protein